MESAICPHLRTTRTIATTTPDEYEPPFPAFASRFPLSIEQPVMVIIGAQAFNGLVAADALQAVQEALETSRGSCSPKHFDLCSFQDRFDKHNVCFIAYWSDKVTYESWKNVSNFSHWWQSSDREKDDEHGWFLEELVPSIDRLETVFSDRSMCEGFSTMEESKSEAIKEHAYWGSMRDRLPVAQYDPIESDAKGDEYVMPKRPTRSDPISGRRRGKQMSNLCVIRSGQDWTTLQGTERAMYLDSIHPRLLDGMTFLRDQGDQVGCFDCRFMQVVHPSDLTPTDRTFGLAYFCDMAHLERWAKDHPTHLEIFHKFLQYASDLQGDVHLQLYHDVFVLKPTQQKFEYINCHAASGLLHVSP